MTDWCILFRNEMTGNAWWPVEPVNAETLFEDNTQYKICGKVYTKDTTVFRDARYEAIRQAVWDLINKKGP